MSEIAGQRIRKARPMTVAEQGAEDWAPRRHGPTVLELQDGTVVYAVADGEPATLMLLRNGRSEPLLPSAMEVTG
jgi:hypothetical protein